MKGAIYSVLCVVALFQEAVLVKESEHSVNICGTVDSNDALVAHKYCNYFYQCSHGIPVTIKCPKELLYDFREQRCEWPNSVKCGNRIIPDNDDESEEIPTTEVGDNVNDDPGQASALCASKGSDHSYVAHEICNKFYQCWAGKPIPLPCPVGTLWNPKKNYCDFPYNVDCGDRIILDNIEPEEDSNLISDDDIISEDDAPIGNNHDDPSQAEKICSDAGSSGVLVAHENCNQFYKCTYGVPVAKLCPSGLLFDPIRDRCEWPHTVNCGDRIIPEKDDESDESPITEGSGNVNDDPSQAGALCAAEGSDHSYVAHEICNKFYQCWAGKPIPLPCPVGTLWNPKKNYCDFPYNVDCGDRIILDNIEPEEDSNLISDDDIISEDDAPIGNNHDDPSQAEKICSDAGSSGVLVAHENCNQFYKCTYGVPVAKLCPSGLLFDPIRDRCEWPHTVNCGDRIIPEKDDESDESPITEGSGNVNDDPSQAGALCAAEGSDHSYVAHEICNKFYQCWAGKPIPLPCPVGTLWNPKKNYCDFPYNVDCGDRIILDNIEPEEDSNLISDDDIISEDDAPIGNNHDDPSQAEKICSDAGSSGVLVAHENCNQFYKCTYGDPVAKLCPSGLLFDPIRDRCEWPHTVNCGDRIIPEKDDESDESPITEGSGNVNDDPSQAGALCAAEGSDHSYVAHEICNKFYQCWAGKPIPLPCPVGTLWNPKKNYCDFPYNVDCGDRIILDNIEPEEDSNLISDDDIISEDDAPIGNNHDDPSQAEKICSDAGSSGVLVAHENCNQFYKCTYGVPVAKLCPSGLLFDPIRDRCEWPHTVNCGDRIIPEKDDESDESPITEGSGNVNDDPSQAGALCAAEGSDHSYVAHEICNKFYQCWAGKPIPLPCPVGTLWNPKKNYCDFPYNVDCGDRIILDNIEPEEDSNLISDDDIISEDDAPIGNNHDDPSQAEKICSDAGSSGVLVAHENCNQFYKCTYGVPVAKLCPSGLLFDPIRDRCEWPHTVNCGDRIIPEKDDESDESPITEGSGIVNDDISQAGALCAAEGSDHSYVAHEICNKFYQCWAGKPVPLLCPVGTLWDPKKKYCDFPYNVNCGDRLVPADLQK